MNKLLYLNSVLIGQSMRIDSSPNHRQSPFSSLYIFSFEVPLKNELRPAKKPKDKKMPRQQNSNNRSVSNTNIYAPPPKIWHTAPAAPVSSSMWQSVKDGIGLGAGSAIGQRMVGGILGPSTTHPAVLPEHLPPKPYFASEHYIQCLEANPKNVEICRPFLSKDKSPWTLCMEQNFYKADYCSEESSKTR